MGGKPGKRTTCSFSLAVIRKSFRNGNVLFSRYCLNWYNPAIDLCTSSILQQTSQQFNCASSGKIGNNFGQQMVRHWELKCWCHSCLLPWCDLALMVALGWWCGEGWGWPISAMCLPFGLRAFFARSPRRLHHLICKTLFSNFNVFQLAQERSELCILVNSLQGTQLLIRYSCKIDFSAYTKCEIHTNSKAAQWNWKKREVLNVILKKVKFIVMK